MDFTLPDGVAELRGRVREFVAAHVIPLEGDPASYDAEHENIRLDLLDGLRARAKAEGLWALQMPRERGGQGLGVVGMAATYEEMGRSIFGPPVFNSVVMQCATAAFVGSGGLTADQVAAAFGSGVNNTSTFSASQSGMSRLT